MMNESNGKQRERERSHKNTIKKSKQIGNKTIIGKHKMDEWKEEQRETSIRK